MPRSPLDDAALDVLTSVAQLELSPERRAMLRPVLDNMLAQLDVMNQVDVGETPPTNSFDPRWRG